MTRRIMHYRNSILLALIWATMASSEEIDWTKNCSRCTCIWANSRKTANCAGQGLNSVPKDLSGAIRDIDFSFNPLYQLGSMEIFKSNLKDIQKLKFQNCSIQSVAKTAFSGLGHLIELDLSRNSIAELDREVFQDNTRLRIFSLSHNNVKRLEEGLFRNKPQLQRIYLDHNLIEHITEGVFENLPALNHINLGYNQIQRITFDLKDRFPKLNSLSLEGNPWICDCYLESFRQSTLRNYLITTPTECVEPPRLKGRMWNDAVIFACAPVILEPLPSTQVEATSYNVTLTCKVSGEPKPDVDWTNNGRILEKDPRQKKNQKYTTSIGKLGDYTWNNLTIINVSYKDRGEYRCVAKNPGGEDERNLTLIVALGSSPGAGIVSGLGNSTMWIIGLSVGLIVLLVIILILVCCFCRRPNNVAHSKRRDISETSEEYVSMRGVPEIKKTLITEINPLTKPPRSSVPASVVSGGTEVSDVKRTLLDNESVFDVDDETRSLEYDQPLLRKSQILLDSDYRLNNHYPPDLLPFPPRASQVSPAGSNASTVADTTRLPAHHGPQSPLHSPLYDYHPHHPQQLNSIYRTLPYSRSHSPFGRLTPIQAVPRVQRQPGGYLTIPRRPRQSWSSEPPLEDMDNVPEPLYDNLGQRTTVTGSTKSPIVPIDEAQENLLSITSHNEAPVKDQLPATPVAACQTLPKVASGRLTPSRTQWAVANAEALKSPEKKSATPPPSEVKKIPPRPPPKPKKKPPQVAKRLSAGPLFDDEGEDGTEV